MAQSRVKRKRCPTCGRLEKRSTQANARYWLLLHEIADHVRPRGHEFSAESWHSYFKQRFIGTDEVKLPNRKTLLLPKSSADLDTAEFADYQTQVEAWAAEHDVYLQDLAA
jgi:hypothetical protein